MKRGEQVHGELYAMDTSRDGSMSPRSDGLKSSAREPEAMSIPSPGDGPGVESKSYYKPKSMYPEAMDTDSPSSYPKHVIVPSPPDTVERHQKAQRSSLGSRASAPDRDMYGSQRPGGNIVTPVLTHEPAPALPVYDRYGYHYPPAPSPAIYYPGDPHYPPPPHYRHAYYGPPPELDVGHSYAMGHNVQMRPKRWACDYCNAASFFTYEDACAHEECCPARQGSYGHRTSGQPAPKPPQTQMYNTGLGALFQATREVQSNSSPSVAPRFNKFRTSGQEGREGAIEPMDPSQKRMLLAMPNDSDSLSDRQCYVRTNFVEVFAATDKDVSARHSKGAQKLIKGQVGIRCIHCSHLRPKDRAERAVCYPSSVSRIYQTVADMQRFHFEQCRQIPDDIRKIYKSLKTTRPRGVGSPQVYWIESAKTLNLIDSEEGIRFKNSEEDSTN